MHLSLRRATTALLAVLALATGWAVPAAGAEPARHDVLTVLGERGWLLRYGTADFGPPDAWWVRVPAGTGRDHLGLTTADGSTPWVDLRIAAPEGRPRLEPGHYSTRGLGGPADATLDLGIHSRGCNNSTGSFDVLGLTRDADGTLTSLAVDYSITCQGEDEDPVTGSLRWNSDVPYAYTAVTSFTPPDVGPRQTVAGSVTLTNDGTVPQTLGATSWLPDLRLHAVQSRPRVTRDGCAGVTLAPGASCTVEVAVRVDDLRSTEGYLATPDGTPRGVALSLVRVRAVPGPGPATLAATPRRGGVELSAVGDNPTYAVRRATADGRETEVASQVALPWTDRSVTPGTVYTYRVVPQSGGLAGEPSNAVSTGPLPVPVGEEGTFVPVGPVRVLDTRSGVGAPRGPVGPGRTLRFDPAAGGQVPTTGVSAVLLNVTGTEATAVTHLRVWPAGRRRPETSSLNLVPVASRANQVVVPLGDDGEVELINDAGATHVVVDVQGFYSTADGPHGGGYHPVDPTRVLDTRDRTWLPRGPGAVTWATVGHRDVPWTEATAVEVTLTVTGPNAPGHLTAWSGVGAAPVVSNVNFEPGQTIANHAVVPVSRNLDGEPVIAVTYGNGAPDVVIDVLGWYDADAAPPDDDGIGDVVEPGLRYRPTPAMRLLDTRSRPGGLRAEPGQAVVVPPAMLPPAPAQVVNVTATGARAGGHLTAWSGDGELPPTSTVNFGRADGSTLTTARTAAEGSFAVTVGTSGVHVVVDHLGYFY
ncbi:hypothetical protein [uncultured Cellulomonas sp.]|uniref:hypothetical protein n=1 Tax=uncultured Cellulomonas sp. TaxID=189682 RepID=UPI00260C2C09|nr:hypothetical protein [uncultured Cellulomonas sp.]